MQDGIFHLLLEYLVVSLPLQHPVSSVSLQDGSFDLRENCCARNADGKFSFSSTRQASVQGSGSKGPLPFAQNSSQNLGI